ncbi:MAG: O-antigen ligase family protein [Acidobacteriota bacterium]
MSTKSDSIRNPQSAIRNAVDRSIAIGLMVTVVFTSLALGTVEAWSVAIFELIVLVLVLLWAAKAVLDKKLEIRIPSPALPLGAFVLLGLAQSIAITGSGGQTSSLSKDVEATRGAVAVIFFLFICFLIAANFFTSPERLRTLANFLIIFGLALAVFALIQHFTWEGKLFWVRPTAAIGAGTGGPFVNRNHFAGYMEMLIPIPLALALSRRAQLESRLFYGFAAAIMGLAEAASLSRGGMISLVAGVFFIALMTLRRKHRASEDGRRSSLILNPATVIVMIVGAIIIGVVWIGADSDILRRMIGDPLTSNAAMDRQGIWADTLRMFRANPILGVGLGAFETVYPIYGRGDGSLLVQFAHNDYLQVLSDGGVVAGAIAVWFIVAVARTVAEAMKSSAPLLRALGLGTAAGIFALLVHSLFDFNLQIPSNALLFLILSAIASSAAAAVGPGGIERSPRGMTDDGRPNDRMTDDRRATTVTGRLSSVILGMMAGNGRSNNGRR